MILACLGPDGGDWGSGPLPLENHKAIGNLRNTGLNLPGKS